jgi:hypothetical protein
VIKAERTGESIGLQMKSLALESERFSCLCVVSNSFIVSKCIAHALTLHKSQPPSVLVRLAR